MHLTKYAEGWTRRHFLEQVSKRVFAAGVLSPLMEVIGRNRNCEAAYPPELLSIEAYTRDELKASDVLSAENVDIDFAARVVERKEDVFVQTLLSQAAVEALDECVPDRLSRRDELQLHTALVRRLIEHAAGKFRSVVPCASGHGRRLELLRWLWCEPKPSGGSPAMTDSHLISLK